MAKKKIEKRLWRNLYKTANVIKELSSFCEYFVFFDTETTGLNTSKERIIQISAIKTDKNLNIIKKFNSYCNPFPMLVSPKITEITGITQAQVESAPLEKDVMIEFNVFSSDACFIAYNSEFDYEMLTSAFSRAGIEREIHHFDVREVSYDIAPNCSDFKLATVCEYLGISKDGAFHDSMYDIEMTYEIFKRYYEMYITLEDTESRKPKVKVFALNPWSIGKNIRIYVPTSCGSFYYDVIKKHWGEKDANFDDANMADVEIQAHRMAKAKGTTLAKLKESVSYRDL